MDQEVQSMWIRLFHEVCRKVQTSIVKNYYNGEIILQTPFLKITSPDANWIVNNVELPHIKCTTGE